MKNKTISRKRILNTDYEIDIHGRVFRCTSVPNYPRGYQKKPAFIHGTISYNFNRGSIFKSLRDLYLELFGKRPEFNLNGETYSWLVQTADKNNEALQGAMVKRSPVAPNVAVKLPVATKTEINGLEKISGYTAMIGFNSGVSVEVNFSDFCPLG